jgi:hypothetical protein
METTMNKLYKVHQIRLTDNEIVLVNLNGHGSVPKQKAQLAVYKGMWEPEYRKHYTHVSTIVAPSLEDVYKIGNIGPESAIARHGRNTWWHRLGLLNYNREL